MSKNSGIGSKAIQKWMLEADPTVKWLFFSIAKTSNEMVRQWISGRRQLSAAMAGRVEDATTEIARLVPSAPEVLKRGDLCEACKRCPYYKDKM